MKMPLFSIFAIIVMGMALFAPISEGSDLPETLATLVDNHCVDCHNGGEAEGGLNLQSLEWNLEDPHIAGVWVKIHDRLASGEMPPEDASHLSKTERGTAVEDLANRIVQFQTNRYAQHGRAVSRRVNRFEYENILRDLLHDPYLKIADQLPLDGEVHGFAKVGEALDVSHVQVDAYLDAAEFAMRRALEFSAKKPVATTRRYYAREQGRMWAGKGNGGWARFSLALEGLNINEEFSFNKKGFAPVEKTETLGITVDDTEAERTGPWRKSTRRSNHVGDHYWLTTIRTRAPTQSRGGLICRNPGSTKCESASVVEKALRGSHRIGFATPRAKPTCLSIKDRSRRLKGCGFPLGRFTFERTAEVSLSNKDAKGWVIADAVQFVHVDDLNVNKGGNPKRKRGTSNSRHLEEASTAIFRGAYTPFYYGFDKFKAPVRGDYKLRLKARSVLRQTDYVDWEGEKKPRFYPNLVLDASRRYPTPVNDRVSSGKRSEPVKVYSSTLDEPNTQSMLPIGVFEAPPETPEVSELQAFLEKGAMVKLGLHAFAKSDGSRDAAYDPENGWRISWGRVSLVGS